jgi:hypothetical protein
MQALLHVTASVLIQLQRINPACFRGCIWQCADMRDFSQPVLPFNAAIESK